MILFFRKIRQKLLTQNKFSKYLLYAIGEIALVMIGILLALQINNGNEEAKNRITEASYLNSLHKDFLSNKEQLAYSFETAEEAKSAADSVNKYNSILNYSSWNQKNLRLILTDSNWNQMRRWIQHSFFRPETFEPTTGTIDALLSSGKIELIQNEDLKRLIISWNDVYQDYNERQLLHIENVIKFQAFRQRNPDWSDPRVRNSVKWQLELAFLFSEIEYALNGLRTNSGPRRSRKPIELMKTIDAFIALTAPENKK